MDQKDRNIFTYCVTSVIAMGLIVFIVSAAQANTTLESTLGGSAYQRTETRLSDLSSTLAQRIPTISQSQMGNITTQNPAENVYSQIESSMNYFLGIGGMTTIGAQAIGQMATVTAYPAIHIKGALGIMVTMVMLIWEISVGYLAIKLILGKMRT